MDGQADYYDLNANQWHATWTPVHPGSSRQAAFIDWPVRGISLRNSNAAVRERGVGRLGLLPVGGFVDVRPGEDFARVVPPQALRPVRAGIWRHGCVSPRRRSAVSVSTREAILG